jgi:hypothetical protein
MLYKKLYARVSTGWLVGAGEASGIKSVTAFYPEQAATDSNGTRHRPSVSVSFVE